MLQGHASMMPAQTVCQSCQQTSLRQTGKRVTAVAAQGQRQSLTAKANAKQQHLTGMSSHQKVPQSFFRLLVTECIPRAACDDDRLHFIATEICQSCIQQGGQGKITDALPIVCAGWRTVLLHLCSGGISLRLLACKAKINIAP